RNAMTHELLARRDNRDGCGSLRLIAFAVAVHGLQSSRRDPNPLSLPMSRSFNSRSVASHQRPPRGNATLLSTALRVRARASTRDRTRRTDRRQVAYCLRASMVARGATTGMVRVIGISRLPAGRALGRTETIVTEIRRLLASARTPAGLELPQGAAKGR